GPAPAATMSPGRRRTRPGVSCTGRQRRRSEPGTPRGRRASPEAHLGTAICEVLGSGVGTPGAHHLGSARHGGCGPATHHLSADTPAVPVRSGRGPARGHGAWGAAPLARIAYGDGQN